MNFFFSIRATQVDSSLHQTTASTTDSDLLLGKAHQLESNFSISSPPYCKLGLSLVHDESALFPSRNSWSDTCEDHSASNKAGVTLE